ncbi:MAG: F0F1 ATP synthase subunit B [Erysipelothrix sp.]|jgi:F-type H+-transporting ATPase subunit b|nr:F0F1 ATP synthase subunit B [Erysipelothrix sp.]
MDVPDIDILGSLIPDPITMLAQLMATGVLLFVMKKYLWVPVMNLLAKRADLAQKTLDDAHQMQSQAEQQQVQAQAQLKEAAQKAQVIIQRSEIEAKQIKATILDEAQVQAQQKLTQANQQIELQVKAMQDSIQKEIVDVAFLASERLMHDKIDEEFDRKAIETFVKEAKHS